MPKVLGKTGPVPGKTDPVKQEASGVAKQKIKKKSHAKPGINVNKGAKKSVAGIDPASWKRAFVGFAYFKTGEENELELSLGFQTLQGHVRWLTLPECLALKIDFEWMANLPRTVNLLEVEGLDLDVAQVCCDDVNSLSEEALGLIRSLNMGEDDKTGKVLARVKDLIATLAQKNASIKVALTAEGEL